MGWVWLGDKTCLTSPKKENGAVVGVVTPVLCGSCRGRSHVSTGSYGGNRWHETGADQSDPQLYSREVRTTWEEPQRPRHVWNIPERCHQCSQMDEGVTYMVFSFRVNMYSEGLMDLMEMIMILPFTDNVKEKLENIEKKAKTRYLPVFEKVRCCLRWTCSGRANTQLQSHLQTQEPVCSGFLQIRLTKSRLDKVELMIVRLLNFTGSDWKRAPGRGENKHGWCAAARVHPDAGGEVLWNSGRLSQHKGDFSFF